MKFCLIGLIILLISSYARTEVRISGKIQDTLFVADRNPYIVTGNAVVPSGQKLVIAPGCVIMFKPFTDITIEGTFLVEGTSDKPVIFTSENDTKYNSSSSQFPNPFDWNGILITSIAEKVSLSHFNIKYSVYGLKSYKTDITVENGIFNHNGQSSLTINETMKNVIDGIAFSYKLETKSANYSTSGQDTDLQGNSSLASKPFDRKKIAIIGCIGGAALSLGATTYFFSQTITNGLKYNKASGAMMDKYYNNAMKNMIYGSVCAVPTITLSIISAKLINKVKKETENTSDISLLPNFGQCGGLSLVVHF